MTETYVVVGPSGVRWIGLAENEHSAWTVAFGWPTPEEIAVAKAAGWYCVKATVTWKAPHHD